MNNRKKLTERSRWSEKSLEGYLQREVRRLGGICMKICNNGMAGMPDRVCLLPGGVTVWVELKSRGESPRQLQGVRMRRLAEAGHEVAWANSREMIDKILSRYVQA